MIMSSESGLAPIEFPRPELGVYALGSRCSLKNGYEYPEESYINPDSGMLSILPLNIHSVSFAKIAVCRCYRGNLAATSIRLFKSCFARTRVQRVNPPSKRSTFAQRETQIMRRIYGQVYCS
jgi:hypothetical protein